MSSYIAFLKMRMRVLFRYRAAAFAGICTQLFWGFIQVMIFQAFYQNSHNEPLQLTQTITFIWLAQALIQMLPWTIDREIEALIKSGNVVYELLRPLELYGVWFARSFSMRFIPTAMRALPIFIVGGFFGLQAPVSWLALCYFIFSLFIALLVSASVTALVSISFFWTISGEGLSRLVPGLVALFSGLAVPLLLFPNWMQPFLDIQPFRVFIDIPCRLYTGIISVQEAPFYLFFQCIWLVLFVLFGAWLMNRACKRLVIHGG